MSFIRELFSDTGTVSMMRLLSLICVLTAFAIAIHAISNNRDLSETAILCGVFLSAGIGGKVAQHITESKDVDR